MAPLARRAAPARAQAIGLKHGFRSGLEESNAKFLESRGVVVAFESLKIPWVLPETPHKYTPDFPLPNGIIVETKGRFLDADRAKHIMVKAQFPDLDIRFVFSNPKAKIRKGSPTTLAMWAERHGFAWAAKLIPASWILEDGPQHKPERVIPYGPNGFVRGRPCSYAL